MFYFFSTSSVDELILYHLNQRTLSSKCVGDCKWSKILSSFCKHTRFGNMLNKPVSLNLSLLQSNLDPIYDRQLH